MKITEVKTLKQLKKLYDAGAMTWEGLTEDSFGDAMECCCRQGVDGEGFVTKGKVMNELCGLTGDNAYKDGLTIFSIVDFVGLAVHYGARWMDDVVDNNARREGYDPFAPLPQA